MFHSLELRCNLILLEVFLTWSLGVEFDFFSPLTCSRIKWVMVLNFINVKGEVQVRLLSQLQTLL